MGPGALAQVLRCLPSSEDPDYLNRDVPFADTGIYRLSKETALVQTVDFFTPVVDDPYLFGQIAAANSLSDIYTVGAKPLTALNIICFPSRKVPLDVMAAILRGGYDKIREAGAVLVGGHSIDDLEPKYGLAVTGLVDPRRLIDSSLAKQGDCLVLTKPLGTGVITTALKGGILTEAEAAETLMGMAALNDTAAEVFFRVGVTACTDVTGFGLLGHLIEILENCRAGAVLETDRIPLYPGTDEMAKQGLIPAGAYRNLGYYRKALLSAGTDGDGKQDERMLLYTDPQTSGGLLAAVQRDRLNLLLEALQEKGVTGWVIGELTEASGMITLR